MNPQSLVDFLNELLDLDHRWTMDIVSTVFSSVLDGVLWFLNRIISKDQESCIGAVYEEYPFRLKGFFVFDYDDYVDDEDEGS